MEFRQHFTVVHKVTVLHIRWGSEYQTSLVFKWVLSNAEHLAHYSNSGQKRPVFKW